MKISVRYSAFGCKTGPKTRCKNDTLGKAASKKVTKYPPQMKCEEGRLSRKLGSSISSFIARQKPSSKSTQSLLCDSLYLIGISAKTIFCCCYLAQTKMARLQFGDEKQCCNRTEIYTYLYIYLQ